MRCIEQACFLMLAAVLALPVMAFSQEKDREIPLHILSPKEGETVEGFVRFLAYHRGMPDKPLTVVVECGELIHYMLLEPDNEFADAYYSEEEEDYLGPLLKDAHLFLEPGPHTLTVKIRELNGATSLLEKQIKFTLVSKDIEKDIEESRDLMDGNASSLIYGKRRLHESMLQAVLKGGDPKTGEKVQERAEGYRSNRISEFYGRIRNYCTIAELFEVNHELEKARKALDLALEIYEEEKESAHGDPLDSSSTGEVRPGDPYFLLPPDHYRRYVDFYARRGNLESAVMWLKNTAEFLQEKTENPDVDPDMVEFIPDDIAETYYKIACLHLLLQNDLDGYREWEKKALEIWDQIPDDDEKDDEGEMDVEDGML